MLGTYLQRRVGRVDALAHCLPVNGKTTPRRGRAQNDDGLFRSLGAEGNRHHHHGGKLASSRVRMHALLSAGVAWRTGSQYSRASRGGDQQFARRRRAGTARVGGTMRVRGLLGMLALLVLALSPVHAEEPTPPPANPAELEKRAVRLDALFTRLASTDDTDEGDTIVEEIWRVWLQSGRPRSTP